MTAEINRRKASMVLHAIEMALGNYVVNTESEIENISPEIVENISERELKRTTAFNKSSVQDIVEATYLDEIFQIALTISKHSNTFQYLERLKCLFQFNNIYHVRNVISHPNKKFIDSYWYKLAAIASDPVIDILGLDSVKKALVSAENGEIKDPPEEWYNQSLWQIPNNLPSSFEHAITGLVGRQREAKELLEALGNPRINTIAVVAPGGLGKTALTLQIISEQMALPETESWCDACLFVSMKTETLTSEGLKNLEAAETIEQLKEELLYSTEIIFNDELESFDELIEKYKNKKLVLFLDNLETLLIDSHAQFEKFNLSLPALWRVIVTSRISIPSSNTTVTLKPLDQKAASHMARIYAQRKGRDNLNQSVFEDIARKCHCNPLAIRLTVDLFLTGKEVPESIQVANKEIANFSFNNLINTLDNNEVKLLEALFLTHNSTRQELCELLELSREEVASGISKLSNTSLIIRNINDEQEDYSLSGSIRELLLTSPKNISVRDSIQRIINKRKALALQIGDEQKRKKTTKYDYDYIPSSLNENLKILLRDFNFAIKKIHKAEKIDSIIKLHSRFKDLAHLYSDIAIFHRAFGRLLLELNAIDQAISHFEKAIELDPSDPNNKVFLAKTYHNISDFSKAEKLYSELIEDGWTKGNKSEYKVSGNIIDGYYYALLFGHKYDTILNVSKDWKEQGRFRGVIGAFRASAWKRKSEAKVNTDMELVIKCLTKAIRILNDVLSNDGYIKSACLQAKNIFSEIAYCLNNPRYINNIEFRDEALTFIDQHLFGCSQTSNYMNEDEVIELINKLSQLTIPNNPFNTPKYSFATFDDAVQGIHKKDVLAKELLEVSVTNIPTPRNGNYHSSYIFAKDKNGNDYFLHYDQFLSGDWRQWCKIKIGCKLAIKSGTPVRARDEATTAYQIYRVIE